MGCHWVLGTPYPKDRTGIYLLPLDVGCWLLGLREMQAAGRAGRAVAAMVAAALAGVAALFAVQMQADYLYLWRFDAGTERVYHRLADLTATRPGTRVGHDWIFEPVLNFYRETAGPGPLPPFGRDGPDGDYDVYYLEARTARAWVRAGRIRVVYEDPVSGSVLGVPEPSSRIP